MQAAVATTRVIISVSDVKSTHFITESFGTNPQYIVNVDSADDDGDEEVQAQNVLKHCLRL